MSRCGAGGAVTGVTKRFALVGSVLVVVAVLLAGIPPLRSRIELLGLALAGRLPEMGVADAAALALAGASVDVRRLRATQNPHLALAASSARSEVDAGAVLFRSRCARCHGDGARGAVGPALNAPSFRGGTSDWYLFKTIREGVSGTEMVAAGLSRAQAWQVVSYLRSLAPDANDVTATTMPEVSVSPERLLAARDEPDSWLTYSGSYDGQRYSGLASIDVSNAARLQVRWIRQVSAGRQRFETSPLVVDGVMFATEPGGGVLALDAATGESYWRHERPLPDGLRLCCGQVNRGVAVAGGSVIVGTLDAKLVALDAASGRPRWQADVADHRDGFSITSAPLALGDMVVVGVGGGEFGIRGFLDAYDVDSGRRLWRRYTIPEPGEPGSETWTADSWMTGGGPTWLTGSYDPDLGLVYWGVGNPAPDFRGDERAGDNLYTNSVLALRAADGSLAWHFQFTPHDLHDWDAAQIPVLVDQLGPGGRPRPVMLWANRNGFVYRLDRRTGAFLGARAFARQSWAEGIDTVGRPIVRDGSAPSVAGSRVYPSMTGATNWWPPAYSRRTGLLYVPVLEQEGVFFESPSEPGHESGGWFYGSATHPVAQQPAEAFIRALEGATGETRWEFPLHRQPIGEHLALGGLLTTAGDVVFGADGPWLVALDARDGTLLWQLNLGGLITAAPVTYRAGGRQLVTVAAGSALVTIGLP